jgi:hypothetical protein
MQHKALDSPEAAVSARKIKPDQKADNGNEKEHPAG